MLADNLNKKTAVNRYLQRLTNVKLPRRNSWANIEVV